MQILHALVGYLAVTTLPFHPFAFASPTTIDYDGYVNTTQNPIDDALMKHALGNIMETCQTINHHSGYVNTTSQNHTDSQVMKRVPGDIIEARQAPPPAALAPVLGVTLIVVAAVLISIPLVGHHDNKVRGKFR